jgi:hypothetical protein
MAPLTQGAPGAVECLVMTPRPPRSQLPPHVSLAKVQFEDAPDACAAAGQVEVVVTGGALVTPPVVVPVPPEGVPPVAVVPVPVEVEDVPEAVVVPEPELDEVVPVVDVVPVSVPAEEVPELPVLV